MSLFSRFRSQSSSRESVINEDDRTHPHNWDFPSHFATSGHQPTVIPTPKLFNQFFAGIDSSPAPLGLFGHHLFSPIWHPTNGHVAVHLCLLECFWGLKKDAKTLAVNKPLAPPSYEQATDTSSSADQFSQPNSDEKWHLLMELAVARFRIWFENIERLFRHASAYTNHTGKPENVLLSKNYLPPLDIILVWYAFLLNPTAFREDCARLDKRPIMILPFPWTAIHEIIDKETMTYTLPKPAATLFLTLSGQNADILAYMAAPPAYTEQNKMPFSLNLAAVVEDTRIAQLIEDAHDQLLIRSPGVKGSIERALQRYFQWVSLYRKHVDRNIVPPPDVEIVLRTHQLTPSSYWALGFDIHGQDEMKFDRTDVKRSETYVEQTRRLWEEIYEEPYSMCMCWICERIRDYDSHWFQGAGRSPVLRKEQERSVRDDVGFYRAVEFARQREMPLPRRPPPKEVVEIEKQRQK